MKDSNNNAIVVQNNIKDKNIKNLVPQCPSALMPLKKKLAFTLAEILITLGIIGVVAAMTIPNLITNYKANRMRTQFLKSYSTVQQAFKFMQEDDVSIDINTYSAKMGSFYETFKIYFKGAHFCGYYKNTSNILPCTGFLSQKYKSLDGKYTLDTDYFTDGQIVLPDGTLILIDNPNWGDFVYIFVDLNGYGNPPNRAGYDLFAFQLIDEELKAMGERGTTYTDFETYCNPKEANKFNGIACAALAKSDTEYFKNLLKNKM